LPFLNCLAKFLAKFAGPRSVSPAFKPAEGRLGAFGTGRASMVTGQVQFNRGREALTAANAKVKPSMDLAEWKSTDVSGGFVRPTDRKA
jgi:hypothetical protein